MGKLKMSLLATVLVLILSVAALCGCALRQFGQAPQDTSAFEALPYFAEGVFISPVPTPFYRDKIEGHSGGTTSMLLRHVVGSSNKPDNPLPMIRLDKNSFPEKPEQFAIYWLGHASLLIELDGKRMLVDPVFGNAAPLPFAARRHGPPPLKRKDLPHIDYVLITHDHYDHLEKAAVRDLKSRNLVFVVPLGVSDHLRKWGVPDAKIKELGWGDAFVDGNITIIAETGVHFSGRTFSTRNSSLWASYVIKGTDTGKRLFVSGDTGYGEHFKEIGNKYGPFDVAFIEIDAWNPGWPKSHPFPDETIRIYHDVKAKALLPVHWAVFDLAMHPWDRSINMVAELADADGNVVLLTPMMGQRVVPGETKTSRWWLEK